MNYASKSHAMLQMLRMNDYFERGSRERGDRKLKRKEGTHSAAIAEQREENTRGEGGKKTRGATVLILLKFLLLLSPASCELTFDLARHFMKRAGSIAYTFHM